MAWNMNYIKSNEYEYENRRKKSKEKKLALLVFKPNIEISIN